MVDELIRKLLEAGVHFGHQTHRWNPKMKPFIFGERSGIYIIDLEKTADCLNKARTFLKEVASRGGRILYVGTKKQAQPIVEEEAKRAEMYYIRNRWLGGLLTNFSTVRKSIERLDVIEEMANNGIWENLKKKEQGQLNLEKEKLLKNLGGIREMKRLPDVVFVIDPKREEIAVLEAVKLGIPIVGLIDTNCDPDKIDYPIPGNDDALKSIKFVASYITDTIVEGRKEYIENTAKQQEKKKEAAQAKAAPKSQDNVEEKSSEVEESSAL